MKTAFRQVSLTTTAEAEEAVGWVLEKVFEQTPSVFTHPEKLGPILSVYLETNGHRSAPARRTGGIDGRGRVRFDSRSRAVGGQTFAAGGLGRFLEKAF